MNERSQKIVEERKRERERVKEMGNEEGRGKEIVCFSIGSVKAPGVPNEPMNMVDYYTI
jgi:hypothetical protein